MDKQHLTCRHSQRKQNYQHKGKNYHIPNSKLISPQVEHRGGDSSRVPIDWITPLMSKLGCSSFKLRVLGVGALNTKRLLMSVTKIDLHSQGSGILQQGFIEWPIRMSDEGFHLISLSLAWF
jgi:25S rRNA (adenine(2142)-N(1))-methyltransferase Bmt2